MTLGDLVEGGGRGGREHLKANVYSIASEPTANAFHADRTVFNDISLPCAEDG